MKSQTVESVEITSNGIRKMLNKYTPACYFRICMEWI